jgi:putative albumin-binding protein homolog-1
MKIEYPIYKFKLSEEQYQIITEENLESLPCYMKENHLKKVIITNSEDKNGWNSSELPNLTNFSFIEELLVYWTNIKNIKGIECCNLLKTLWIDNDDRTDIDFKKFPYLQKFISWDRKNIQNIWKVPTLKELTLAGVKPNSFHSGEALKSLIKLRILNTSLKDISFMENGINIDFLELLNLSKIEDLTPLRKLKNLKHLRIDCNKVVDFSFLKDLINLERLYISSKVGVFEFDYFLGLTLLKKVNISGNSKIQTFNRELQKKINIDNE